VFSLSSTTSCRSCINPGINFALQPSDSPSTQLLGSGECPRADHLVKRASAYADSIANFRHANETLLGTMRVFGGRHGDSWPTKRTWRRCGGRRCAVSLNFLCQPVTMQCFAREVRYDFVDRPTQHTCFRNRKKAALPLPPLLALPRYCSAKFSEVPSRSMVLVTVLFST